MDNLAQAMHESVITPTASLYWSISLFYLRLEIRRLIERESYERNSWSI
jgi:hypothetical protein